MARLFEELEKLKNKEDYPFHMPGHKRNVRGFIENAYDIDITEIDGFDNLHDAGEIIREAEINAAKIYKSSETHFLVNGSTCGILSAISAVTEKGDKIIVARNCHKSVYNGMFLNELKPVFVYPRVKNNEKFCLDTDVKIIKEALKNNPDAKAVLIVSPTYDGIISNISKIADTVHEYNIPLIVDEAHGAHLFLEKKSAIEKGADIVINSVHKTLGALTQTALIHINGSLVDRKKLREYLTIYQTSSPSYVLMGSIDYAMFLIEKNGQDIYKEYVKKIDILKNGLKNLKYLKHITKENLETENIHDFDEGKIIISTVNAGISGKNLMDIMQSKYKIVPEMSMGKYVLFMLTLFDSYEGIERLKNALIEIDNNIEQFTFKNDTSHIINTLEGRTGEISDKTVYSYPPGIPVVVKGEVITDEIIEKINEYINDNLDVKGL